MIHYNAFTLANGLRVFVHTDSTLPTATVNVLYDVGSRDEHPDKTGFAHLFEHLMFGGSKHVTEYDLAAQRAGATNNAFTSPDITNYYLVLPKENLETAFWLESDRMWHLSLDAQVLEVQRKVVIEEFKQRYLNQPYGDVWLKLRPLAYTTHPYRWATIGKEIGHIEQATMDDVRTFYNTYYAPNNAILVVGGNVTVEEVRPLAEKWFGEIPSAPVPLRNLPQEPVQTAYRQQTVQGNVPQDALYMVYHMCAKTDEAYYPTDLLSDVLGRGKSSYLYQKLVKEQAVFSNIGAYVSGSFDAGLLTISGRMHPGVSPAEGEQAVQACIESVLSQGISEEELSKVKAQAESTVVFSEMEVLNRCIKLAQAAVLGNPDLANQEPELIRQVTPDQVLQVGTEILRTENLSSLYYHKA